MQLAAPFTLPLVDDGLLVFVKNMIKDKIEVGSEFDASFFPLGFHRGCGHGIVHVLILADFRLGPGNDIGRAGCSRNE